jgi:hypothetical protein
MSSTENSRIWQIVAGSTTTASESRDKARIARTLRWRSRLGFRDQWQSRVLGGGVEREEVVRRPISCIHDVLPPIKDHQEIRQPETDHRRESRTVHASNGVRDRIITLQTHNHERERELATPRLASSPSSLEPAGELRCEMRGTVGEREEIFSGYSSNKAPASLFSPWSLIPSCAWGCFYTAVVAIKKAPLSLSLPITALS